MNRIPVKRLISSRNLLFSCQDHGRFLQKPLSNALSRLLFLRQPQISIIDVDKLLLNRPKRFPQGLILIARASLKKNNFTPNASTNRFILPQKALRSPRRSTPPLTDNRLVEPFNNNVPVNYVALGENFCLKKRRIWHSFLK